MQENLLGGSASYAALAASIFCKPVHLVGIVGHDFPAGHLDMLSGKGVDLAGVERSDGESFTWSGEYFDDMNTRKNHMMEMADGLLALPGGLGTLEEVSEAFSWTALGDNAKPVALYNYRNFYQPLKDMLATMEMTGFTEPPYVNAIKFATNFDEVADFMNHYQAPAIRTYE